MRTWRATARYVELLEDIHVCADLPVVKPKHEIIDDRWQMSDAEVRRQSLVVDWLI